MRSGRVNLARIEEVVHLKLVDLLDVLVTFNLDDKVVVPHTPVDVLLLVATDSHLLEDLFGLLVKLILEQTARDVLVLDTDPLHIR